VERSGSVADSRKGAALEVFGKLERTALFFFVWLQSELEQSGSILCLVEESSEVENNHRDGRVR
jgi:hypothetical protein